MEGVGQIVVFLVIIVLSIVQQVIRSNNKKKQQQNTPQQGNEPEQWYEFNTPEENQYNKGSISEEYAAEHEYFSYENDYSGTDITAPASFTQTHKEPAGGPLNISGVNAIDDISTASELMDDFDLRKAVIYSEILKPKYQEDGDSIF